MEKVFERLKGLHVADCMSTNVVPILAHQTMTQAAQLLCEHGISGGPVVDEQGRCVGMLSAADFMRREHAPGDARAASAYAKSAHDRAGEGALPLEITEIFTDTVSRHMSPAVQSVRADTPLVEAARMMCGCHVHRLPVLDQQGRPEGMLTALDLSAVLVHVMNEAEQSELPRRG